MSQTGRDVSAVIPAHNAERFLARALASVLTQTHPVTECIVVDDGSTDPLATEAVVKQAGDRRVRSLRLSPSRGMAGARNAGAGEAAGDLLAFLDADDRWMPRRLERQLASLNATGADAVLCANHVIGDNPPMGRVVRMRPPRPTLESLLGWGGTVVSTSSNLLIQRKVFAGLGGFDQRLGTAADWELLARLATRANLAYVDEPLVEYVWHGSNASRDAMLVERDLSRAYEILLARERTDRRVERVARAGLHRTLADLHLSRGRRSRGLWHLAQSARHGPILLARRPVARLRRRWTRR
jgi:glycosyltransferase involved in cell wall biosynthesis